jgi:hypothetical protein
MSVLPISLPASRTVSVLQWVLNNCRWVNEWISAEKVMPFWKLPFVAPIPLMLHLFSLSSRYQSQEEVCPRSAPWRTSTASPTIILSNLKTSSWPPCLESWPLHKVSSVLGQKTWDRRSKIGSKSLWFLKKYHRWSPLYLTIWFNLFFSLPNNAWIV